MGFRKISDDNSKFDKCLHPEHNPPMHISLQPGTYEYTCPACGQKQILVIPRITI